MKYYVVEAQFSHVSRNGYIIKTVPTVANNAKEAAYRVRWMPRAKHHQKDAIISVTEVSEDDYYRYLDIYKNDPYFKAKNRQEQNETCPEIYEDVRYYCDIEPGYSKNNRRNSVQYRRKKYKNALRQSFIDMRSY